MNPSYLRDGAVARGYAVPGGNIDRPAEHVKQVVKLNPEVDDRTPPSRFKPEMAELLERNRRLRPKYTGLHPDDDAQSRSSPREAVTRTVSASEVESRERGRFGSPYQT